MKNKTQETLDRVTWLDAARYEARHGEAQKVSRESAFDWARVEPRRWRFPMGRMPRLAVVGVLILVLGSAAWAIGTVTWRGWHADRDIETTGVRMYATPKTSASLHRRVRAVGPAPLVRIPTTAASSASSLVTVERSVRGALLRRAPRAVAHASPKAPPVKVSPGTSTSAGPEAASSGRLRLGEEVIIVTPRAKLKPLFTPEEYKKRH
ncbi:MAG: hypothetical protein KAI47_04790 [Deltaproteobacteria bacterium]|nr:hypothetical protein [Deltaproteobacteria bacterium]